MISKRWAVALGISVSGPRALVLLALRAGLAMYVAYGQMIVSRREYTNLYFYEMIGFRVT